MLDGERERAAYCEMMRRRDNGTEVGGGGERRRGRYGGAGQRAAPVALYLSASFAASIHRTAGVRGWTQRSVARAARRSSGKRLEYEIYTSSNTPPRDAPVITRSARAA